MQNSVGQQNIQMPQQCQCPPQQTAPAQPQAVQQAQYQTQPQGQNVQVPPNYSGVNIQIFNPSVTPPGGTAPVYNVNAPHYNTNPSNGCYPPEYYTNNWGSNPNANNNGNNNTNSVNTTTNTTENTTTNKKTEKREIVQLTDDYIRNLENYLNSQDKEVRLMGAKEVFARLDEDHSRKGD